MWIYLSWLANSLVYKTLKKNFSIKVIFFSFFFTFTCFGQEEPTISVVIPCTNSHIQYLPNLLQVLQNQSCLPSEVIVSISNIHPADEQIISHIQNSTVTFNLKIIKNSAQKFAGENRNIAIANSTGELIICQDADDLPHRQRIEIIKTIFQEQNFDLLLHLFMKYDDPSQGNIQQNFICYNHFDFPITDFEFLNLHDANIFDVKRKNNVFFLKHVPYSELTPLVGIHFGNCAFRKKIFDTVQYTALPTGQDVVFCNHVLEKFQNALLVNLPLVYFIKTRSTRVEREKINE